MNIEKYIEYLKYKMYEITKVPKEYLVNNTNNCKK